MALTDFQKHKFTLLFNMRDTDGNGVVEAEDFDLVTERVATAKGWSPGTTEYEGYAEFRRTLWERIWKPADVNGDGKIELEEYLNFAQTAMEYYESGRMDELLDQFGRNNLKNTHIEMVFQGFDTDEDGGIDLEEYRLFLQSRDIDDSLAEVCFRRLDTDGNGVIDLAEFTEHFKAYYSTKDPLVAGNWLYGPCCSREQCFGEGCCYEEG